VSEDSTNKDDATPVEGELIPLHAEYEGSPNKGGRPRLYDTPQDFDAKVDEYYQYCRTHPTEPLALYGLILFMGFSDYSNFYRYSKFEGFSQSVARARSLVKYGYERNMLLTKNTAAGRVLAAMDAANFNPTVMVDPNAQGLTHEERLKLLR